MKQPKDGKETYVYMKSADNKVQGLVVVAVDPRHEASFVNIVGEIDLEQLPRISACFNIGIPCNMQNNQRDHDKDKSKPKH